MTRSREAPPGSGEPQEDAQKDANEERTRKDRSNDLIKAGADATVELISGVADALGGALRRAGDEFDKDDLTRFGVKNGFVRGFFEGTSHFFEKMPTVLRNTYDVLSSGEVEKKRSSTPSP